EVRAGGQPDAFPVRRKCCCVLLTGREQISEVIEGGSHERRLLQLPRNAKSIPEILLRRFRRAEHDVNGAHRRVGSPEAALIASLASKLRRVAQADRRLSILALLGLCTSQVNERGNSIGALTLLRISFLRVGPSGGRLFNRPALECFRAALER